MNSLIPFFLAVIDINLNLSNFSQNIFVYAFNPYVSLFGNFTWGIIFGFIGAGLFVGSGSNRTAFTYLIIVGLIFSIVLPAALIALFGLVAAFIAAAYMFKTFVKKE